MRSGINNNSVRSFWSVFSCCWGEDPSRNLKEEDANKQLEDLLEELKENGYNLRLAREELKNNKMVVLEAVKKRGFNLEFASEELKNDREVVLMAVKKNGAALLFASGTLRKDREVVLEAVKENYFALKFASEELKNDREVVLEAVKENVAALDYASKELKNDGKFVSEAVKKNYEFQRIKSLFSFHDKIKDIMDEKDEKNAIEEAKINRINEIIHGSTKQPKQISFIQAIDALIYLKETIEEAPDSEKKKKIEDFCKKNPNKSSAILAYLATLYLVYVEHTDCKHIDPEAEPENGFNHFTQKLLENYKQEKTPSPQTMVVSAKPQSSSWDCCITNLF